MPEYRSLELLSSWSSAMIEQITDYSKVEHFWFDHIVDKDLTNKTDNIYFIVEVQMSLC